MDQPQTEYKSAHPFALALIILLAVNALLMALSAVGIAVYYAVVSSNEPQTIMLYGSSLLLLSGINVFLFVAEAVVLLLWQYRAYKNLTAFNAKNLNYTPGWAIAYWFIPILNLFRPLQVLSEIWHGSDPETVESDFNYGNTSIPALFGIWWGLRLIGGISERFIMSSSNSNGLDETSYAISLISSVTVTISLVLLLIIVRGIDNRQQTVARNLDLRKVMPPPPPTFS